MLDVVHLPTFAALATDAAWLTIAAQEIGQQEIPGTGPGQDNPRIVEYFTVCDYQPSHDEVPWCSAFVNWCLAQARVARTKSAAAVSWLRWGTNADDTQGPHMRGAIVVLCRRDAAPDPATGSPTGNHVGFLLAYDPETVTVLGGNQHDAVKVSVFPRRTYRVRAVRWPRACDLPPA